MELSWTELSWWNSKQVKCTIVQTEFCMFRNNMYIAILFYAKSLLHDFLFNQRNCHQLEYLSVIIAAESDHRS